MNEGNYDPNMRGVLFKNDQKGNERNVTKCFGYYWNGENRCFEKYLIESY